MATCAVSALRADQSQSARFSKMPLVLDAPVVALEAIAPINRKQTFALSVVNKPIEANGRIVSVSLSEKDTFTQFILSSGQSGIGVFWFATLTFPYSVAKC